MFISYVGHKCLMCRSGSLSLAHITGDGNIFEDLSV